jgi:carbon-monoxide dehydrogenase medium subunit
VATEAAASLLGLQPSEEAFRDAGRLAAAASDPTDDQRGPVDYKRHLADELTRRVLRRATQRAAAGALAATGS